MVNHRNKFLVSFAVAATVVVLLNIYSYVFLDIQVKHAMSSYYAPANYLALSIKLPLQTLKLTHKGGEVVIIQPQTLQSWIESYKRDYTRSGSIRLNSAVVNAYLDKLSITMNQPPVQARLDYKDGKIVQFNLPTKGVILSNSKTGANIANALLSGSSQAELVFDEIYPDTLAEIERLGIKKLLGHGESNFSNSSAARITNIKVSSSLFNGIIIKPGEEFSFNKILGDVDAVHGYKPELVIKSRGLVKEFGGGICQVATTVFRAAILSGLKIVERHPHAFPVNHYNPQGFDATIYPGVVDLRFINNTQGNILVQTYIQGTKLFFDFYGNDDKIVTVTPPTQYDIKPSGAMKAVFYRTITLPNGSWVKEEFRSNYKSPALFPKVTARNPLE